MDRLSEVIERGAERGALIRRMRMPSRMSKACSYPGCTELVVKGRCEKHREAEVYYRDKGRQALYDRSWRVRRAIQLEDKPWCEDCWEKGIVTVATEVHHVQRHEGDVMVFLSSPLQSLCKACHTRIGNETERAG